MRERLESVQVWRKKTTRRWRWTWSRRRIYCPGARSLPSTREPGLLQIGENIWIWTLVKMVPYLRGQSPPPKRGPGLLQIGEKCVGFGPWRRWFSDRVHRPREEPGLLQIGEKLLGFGPWRRWFRIGEDWVHFPREDRGCYRQDCGYSFISSGSGSSILGWIPIRIQGFNDQTLKKKLQLKIFFFLSKTAIYLSLGLH